MQQRFTTDELQQRGISIKHQTTVSSLLNSRWITGQRSSGANEPHDSDNILRLSIKELLNVSSDWKDVNNLRGANGGGAGNFPGQEPLSQDF